jgi:HSP20 family molecular chaperone IbpA
VALPAPAGIEPQHAEVTLSRYRRTFTLSKELDPEKVSAELVQGVLRVRIPKADHAQPRRVQIQVQ